MARLDPAPSCARPILLQLLLLASRVATERCTDRSLPGLTREKVEGDNGFYLGMTGLPAAFLPGSTYTLSLRGDKYQFSQKTFHKFIITASNTDPQRQTDSGSAGTFRLFGDIHTRFSDHCSNRVVETSGAVAREEAQVLWTAPPPTAGCVVFRATVLEAGEVWSQDSERLTLELCEEAGEEEEDSPVQAQCCACEEAKYEVEFQGLWSKETHPRDFPSSQWLLHFSDLIGASHSLDYRVWRAGGTASKGLAEVAKWGQPRVLEAELKAESRHIRTIIKARGLWHPNVNGKTFAIFRADPVHHLVSVVSMLGPSPDWLVGVSGLEVCQANCTWLDRKEVLLYPWDAGVDSGVSYESPDTPTDPPQPIARITSQQPNDENSPFFKPEGGPIKPLAKLTIQKLREYRKSCSSEAGDTEQETEQTELAGRAECAAGQWSAWSGCSVTCGKGISSRQRGYSDPFAADTAGCDTQLQQKIMCSASVPLCQGGSSFYQAAPADWSPDDTCAATEWTDWSACSAPCGRRGFRARTRRFFNRLGRKKCPHVETVEKAGCEGGAGSDCREEEEKEEVPTGCEVTGWSIWSPCSQSCGSGLKVRTRLYRSSAEEQLQAGCSLPLLEKADCRGADPRCGAGPARCSLPREVGPCRGTFKRWYHDPASRQCREFFFGGCRGNSNNFLKHEDCEESCRAGQQQQQQRDTEIFLNDGFNSALDVLVRERKEKESDGMNSAFVEIEEQKQVIQQLENKQFAAKAGGKTFDRLDELQNAKKKLMLMQKQRMMNKQMMMFKQKQMMMAKQRAMHQQVPPSLSGSPAPVTLGLNETMANQDCQLTAWSPWSVQCSSTCGRGFRTRFRAVRAARTGGGRECPARLHRQKRCRLPACPAPSCPAWAAWSPCSLTCGAAGEQSRERGAGPGCGETRQRRVCLLPDCPQ